MPKEDNIRFHDYYYSDYGIFLIETCSKYIRRISIIEHVDIYSRPNNLTMEVINQLDEYFKFKREIFNLPLYFNETYSHKVLKSLHEYCLIGETTSYKQLGYLLNSKAYQAIGTALKRNHLLIVVPCHRVIKSNNQIGNYVYGYHMKKNLLNHEQIYITDRKTI